MTDTNSYPPVMTREHVAELFHISPRSVRDWIADGKLPSPDIPSPNGRGQRWFRQRIEKWLETGKMP